MNLTWTVRATVVRVVDGDTFDAELDLGWGIRIVRGKHHLGRIRVLNIDSPELNTPEGKIAKSRAEKLLPVGTQVWVQSYELDNFGRCLAKVTFEDGRDFATEMTSLGKE